MDKRNESWLAVARWFLLSALLGCSSCSGDDNEQGSKINHETPRDAGIPDSSTPDVAVTADSECLPAHTEHSIPARAALYAQSEQSGPAVLLYNVLQSRFDAYCSGCHKAPAKNGNFSYTPESFAAVVPAEAVGRILSTDDARRMPPPPWPTPPNDDLKELARDLKLWMDQGRPQVSINLAEPPDDAGSADAGMPSNYQLSRAIGENLTNLGYCIPSKKIVGIEADDVLDQRFAAMQSGMDGFDDLPKTLAETDLFTLDTEVLARHGTVAFAPTYQLWSFDAGKMRMVHVPKGQSIRYDANTQHFILPENTRFYKTFFKPVLDKNHQIGWRKMETRLIVARHDKPRKSGVPYVPQALFATYVWNDAETEATLLEKPYFDGTKFKDLIRDYVTDENVFSETLEKVQASSGSVVLRPLDGTKEYPIPGRHRCVQCHMGSESNDFVLGFTPIQLNRRPLGEGAVYEAPGPDELTQAQRFIDYKIVTGVKSPDEFVKLEDSAGDRKPRNFYELRAQAYMVGNCAHCHNPDGYPTSLNPSLEFLNMRAGGVIFQFPLNQRSPLRFKGDSSVGVRYVDPTLSKRAADSAASPPVMAPWDSLLYRNVEAPRTYDEDGILYPHMPLHVAGIDCRAQEFLGTWNASIPFEFDRDPKKSTDYVDSTSTETIAQAEQRVGNFLAQGPVCEPTQDLRDWGAEPPAFTDQVAPFGVPDRPHWFEEDFTEVYGDFAPRGANWHTALLDPRYAFIRDFAPTQELTDFVNHEVPFDFWLDKPECDFSKAPAQNIDEFWFEHRVAFGVGEDRGDPRRVYSTLPGAAVFEAICSNCHGSRGTAESNLASTIASLTGGRTRVANYSQGLFGPLNNPTANLHYFEDPQHHLDDGSMLGPDGAMKYLMWMALGGTQAIIPPAALRQVAAAKVASQVRVRHPESFASANMLAVAKEVCANTVQRSTDGGLMIDCDYDPTTGQCVDWLRDASKMVAVVKNGEYALYSRLCAIDNPRPVRVLYYDLAGPPKVDSYRDRSVLEQVSLPGGEHPYCAHPESLARGSVPLCPIGGLSSDAVIEAWIERAARNVGFAVYSYLKRAFANPNEWRPRYDQCEQRYPRH